MIARCLKRTVVTLGVVLGAVTIGGCHDDSGSTHIVKSSGDGQSVIQHEQFAQPLAVRVVDADGNGIAGVAVLLSAGNAQTLLAPVTLVTDDQGNASWLGYLHGTGQQTIHVQAQALDVEAVDFGFAVAASGQPYDGVYRLTDSQQQPGDDIEFTVRDGNVVAGGLPTSWSGAIDAAGGTVDVVWSISSYVNWTFTGRLSIDENGQATGSGMTTYTYPYTPLPLPDGQWTAIRY